MVVWCGGAGEPGRLCEGGAWRTVRAVQGRHLRGGQSVGAEHCRAGTTSLCKHISDNLRVSGVVLIFLQRSANHVLSNGVPSSDALSTWAKALNVDSVPTSQAALAEYFAAAGDSVMLRLREHVVKDQGHLAEQIDRNTGVQTSAENLTWSYAEVLNAMHQRDLYMAQR